MKTMTASPLPGECPLNQRLFSWRRLGQTELPTFCVHHFRTVWSMHLLPPRLAANLLAISRSVSAALRAGTDLLPPCAAYSVRYHRCDIPPCQVPSRISIYIGQPRRTTAVAAKQNVGVFWWYRTYTSLVHDRGWTLADIQGAEGRRQETDHSQETGDRFIPLPSGVR